MSLGIHFFKEFSSVPPLKFLLRLLDVVNQNAKLYLVFEYLDLDLKRYMDTIRNSGGMSSDQVKVTLLLPVFCSLTNLDFLELFVPIIGWIMFLSSEKNFTS